MLLRQSYVNLKLKSTWGMYHKKNVDYAFLLQEDFTYQVENKNTKKVNVMHEDTQLYGAILPKELTIEDIRNSESYKEYYAIASGEVPPKTKASVHKKKADSDTKPKEKPPTDPKEKPLRKAEATYYSSQASGSGDGVHILSKVPDEQTFSVGDDDNEDDDANKDLDAHNDDDDDATESDDDGDNITHPKLSTFSTDDQEEEDDEEEQEDDDEDEVEISDQLVCTPSDYQTSNASEKQKDDDRVKNDMKDAHVTLTVATPVVQQQSSSALDLVSKFISPTTDEVNEYLGSKMNEAVDVAIHSKSTMLKKKRKQKIKHSSTHLILTCRKLSRIKSKLKHQRSSLKLRSKEAESSKELTHKESRTTSSSKGASRSQPTNLNETTHLEFITGDDDVIPAKEVHDERQWHPSTSLTPNREWHLTKMVSDLPSQHWTTDLAQAVSTQSYFDEFMDTPIDFSAFMINRLKIDHLTQELLTGPTYDLMKGTPYPHNLSKPLPLIPNAQGHLADDYGQVKWIEDRIPRTTWSVVPIDYDKHAYWGTYHSGPKRQRFYGYATNMETSKDVYSRP
ncbi:hypothetical protein Tco_0653436 [Tanacetum coccineum]|uniref:Uncharacterized protein n=1 Tax=Tanacetum coccineum TaxID=301880 RepID=A0ABQ4X0D2_9ASTR